MTYADGLLVCTLGFVALLFLLGVGVALWEDLRQRIHRNRWLRENQHHVVQGAASCGKSVVPKALIIGDYCDGCHRPIPKDETVWMDTRTGRILHVRCREDELAEDGGRS